MPNNQNPSVKKYYDYANQTIDEQAILDKYNAATLAQFAAQREQNKQTENTFYNQMYNTQKTAMDTIRKANADAVASGASRGVQAANELSALLGLQQESVASATELAQTNRQTAQEETAAVLENVLKAYTQAQQERAQLVSQSIESASIDAQEQANAIAAQEASTDYERYLLDLMVNDPTRYNQIRLDMQNANKSQSTNNTNPSPVDKPTTTPETNTPNNTTSETTPETNNNVVTHATQPDPKKDPLMYTDAQGYVWKIKSAKTIAATFKDTSELYWEIQSATKFTDYAKDGDIILYKDKYYLVRGNAKNAYLYEIYKP